MCLQDGFLERLSSSEFVGLSKMIEKFTVDCEAVCGRKSTSLRGCLQSQVICHQISMKCYLCRFIQLEVFDSLSFRSSEVMVIVNLGYVTFCDDTSVSTLDVKWLMVSVYWLCVVCNKLTRTAITWFKQWESMLLNFMTSQPVTLG